MNTEAITSYCQSLWDTRSAVNSTLEEIASFVAPDRQGFNSAPSAGDEGRTAIWDSTPEDAALTLASALHGMLTNPATDWLNLDLVGMDEEDDNSAADFVQGVTETMLDAFSEPASGFNNEVNVFYIDLAHFGWAVYLVEYKDGKGLRFRAVPPSQCAIAENADGLVDTVLRRWTMTPGQLVEEFGTDVVSDKVREALENRNGQKEIGVSHLVAPREKLPRDMFVNPNGKNRDGQNSGNPDNQSPYARAGAHAPTGGAARGRPVQAQRAFVSIYFETESKNVLRQGSFDELPYMVPRWSKRSGEVYGRGPGHACLPDMRVLNRVAQSQLIGGEKLADPPMLAYSDSTVGKIRTHSGGITYVDASQCPGGNVSAAISQLPVAYRLDVAEAVLEQRRNAIRSAFLNDRIQLAGGPQMTATEVIARERKQNLVLGPVLGRLENEFLGPLTARVFLLLLRNGRLAVPEELAGRELLASYVSPISRAQRQGEAEAFSLAMQYLAPSAQVAPTIFDNFNFDRVARDSQELFGFPRDYLLSEQEVAKARQERAQQQQAAAMAEMAAQAAEAGAI